MNDRHAAVLGLMLAAGSAAPSPAESSAAPLPPLVFVSRAIPPRGSVYQPSAMAQPGTGPHSRARGAAPGQLIVRLADGRLRVLVDGRHPGPSNGRLADVNAPDVSEDGRWIVFAGLPAAAAADAHGPEGYAGAWRLYVIGVDGTGLRQLTFDEPGRPARLARAGLPASLLPFDDLDPAWLPNGAVVFSSTRYPSYAHYSGVRTSNLYTVRADGSDLRRITAERNGADRPLIEPRTGRIVFARWWRNHRMPLHSLETRIDPIQGGFVSKDGLTADGSSLEPPAAPMSRNAWHAARIDPDGGALAMWSGRGRDDPANHVYGGAFEADGSLLANFYPMMNMTEAAGFGGIRRVRAGGGGTSPVIGVADVTADRERFVAPDSYGVYRLGPGGVADWYASDAVPLPDGRVVVSLARDIGQDYGLYTMSADGTQVTPLLDLPGRAELRAKPVIPRQRPPALPLAEGPALPLVPPPGEGPYDRGGRFVFDARNVYFNAPVDSEIVDAPAVGSAASIRFHADFQRGSPGSFPSLDWPILLGTRAVRPDGSVRPVQLPAGVPLFEQLRDREMRVPAAGGSQAGVTAHVAGLNFGAPGSTATCVGCHAGHSQIAVPLDPDDIADTNLAPGAAVEVSSTRDPATVRGLVDRLAARGEIRRYWTSAPGATENQWVRLVFAVPVRVRTVRLYNPRAGDPVSTLQVQAATVDLCADPRCGVAVATRSVGPLSAGGTDVAFGRETARAVRVRIDRVSGSFDGQPAAGLAEIEVIARGGAAP